MVDGKLALLIATGAAIAANCDACLKRLVPDLRDMGGSHDEIRGAIEIGLVVKDKPAKIMREAADTLTGTLLMEQYSQMPCPMQSMEPGMRFKMALLIAAGAAMGSNCEPCLNKIVPDLLEAGVHDSDIQRAVEIGQSVKEKSAEITQEAANRLTEAPSTDNEPAESTALDCSGKVATCCG